MPNPSIAETDVNPYSLFKDTSQRPGGRLIINRPLPPWREGGDSTLRTGIHA